MTVSIEFPMQSLVPDTSNYPELQFDADTGQWFWAFDNATDEFLYVAFRIPDDYSSNPDLIFGWSGDTGNSGDVEWTCQVMTADPNTDDVNWKTADFDTINELGTDDVHLGGNEERPHEVTLDLTNFDGGGAGDWAVFKVGVDGSDSSFSTGDILLWRLVFTYTEA